MVARIVIVLQYVRLEVPDRYRSECPVIVLLLKKGKLLVTVKERLQGLYGVLNSSDILFADIHQKIIVLLCTFQI